jgi:hypothetical protein
MRRLHVLKGGPKKPTRVNNNNGNNGSRVPHPAQPATPLSSGSASGARGAAGPFHRSQCQTAGPFSPSFFPASSTSSYEICPPPCSRTKPVATIPCYQGSAKSADSYPDHPLIIGIPLRDDSELDHDFAYIDTIQLGEFSLHSLYE